MSDRLNMNDLNNANEMMVTYVDRKVGLLERDLADSQRRIGVLETQIRSCGPAVATQPPAERFSIEQQGSDRWRVTELLSGAEPGTWRVLAWGERLLRGEAERRLHILRSVSI